MPSELHDAVNPSDLSPDVPSPEDAPKTEQAVRKTDDGQYVLKVGEAEKTVSEAELFRLAQLAHGAHQRFEEAAQLRQSTEKLAGTLREALLRADQGDATAFNAVLQFMGIDDTTRQAKLTEYTQAWAAARGDGSPDNPDEDEEEDNMDESTLPQETPPQTPPGRREKSPPARKTQLALDDLPNEVQEAVKLIRHEGFINLLKRAAQDYKDADRQKVYDDVWSDVAKDSDLSRIVSKGGARAEKLRALTETLTRGRIHDGEPWGPGLRAAVIKELRSLAQEFGTGSGPIPIPGLGAGPGISHVEAQAEKPPDRVPMSDEKWSETIAKRLAHAVFHGQG